MSKQKDKPIVVISGMSGRFPGVNSVADYAESLFNKKNLISSTKGRYPTDGLFEELPDAIGRVEDLEKFDNNFFNIKPELAHLMDPQARKMLEVTIEAILDAGLSLDDVKTTRTGSFFANIFNDIDRSLTPEHFSHRLNKCSDPSIAFYKQIFQQWVSYCLDLKGPAYHYESACSSALYALSDAFKAIESGLLDTCLIVTANMNVVPSVILQYLRYVI